MSLTKKIILVAGTLLCLLSLSYFLYSIFFEDKMDSRQARQSPQAMNAGNTVTMEGVSPDEVLYNQLNELHRLDERYIGLLADSTAALAALDSLQDRILGAEAEFKKTMDDLLVSARGNTTGAGAQQLRQLNLFRKVLDNRKLFRLANSFERYDQQGVSVAEDKEISQLELELFQKNARIIELEGLLSQQQDKLKTMPTADMTAKETALNQWQEKYTALQQQHTSLQRKFNEAEARINNARNPATLIAEEKLSSMEAALRLAQVDCNLTRADGRAIIYNSKQRKALLQESLTILNSLSGSGNIAVEQQVKERMSELKNIAGMIRD